MHNRSSKFVAVLGLLAVTCWWNSAPVFGVEMASLFTVEVPLDPDDPDPNRAAYRLALTEVLVRLTGSASVAESDELQSLFPNPDRFLRQFRQGPDNTLIVSFNGAEIERLLRQTDAPVWSADRPLTLVWLAVDRGKGRREIVGAGDQSRVPGTVLSNERNDLLRERIKAEAIRRGAPVAFPLLDAEDLRNVGFSDIWGGFDAQLVTASARYGATSILVGRIRSDTPRAHRWTWYRDGQRMDWRGEPEDAVNRLADSLAASDTLPGNQEGEFTQLTISGIDSVRAYGQVQQYLENLRVLDRLTIRIVDADMITYAVEIRGGVDRLRSALAASGFLIPAEAMGGIDGSSFDEIDGPTGNRDPAWGDGRSLDYSYRENARQSVTRRSLEN